jgi:hypothetical protein
MSWSKVNGENLKQIRRPETSPYRYTKQIGRGGEEYIRSGAQLHALPTLSLVTTGQEHSNGEERLLSLSEIEPDRMVSN